MPPASAGATPKASGDRSSRTFGKYMRSSCHIAIPLAAIIAATVFCSQALLAHSRENHLKAIIAGSTAYVWDPMKVQLHRERHHSQVVTLTRHSFLFKVAGWSVAFVGCSLSIVTLASINKYGRTELST
jgi:hypothetical protein